MSTAPQTPMPLPDRIAGLLGELRAIAEPVGAGGALETAVSEAVERDDFSQVAGAVRRLVESIDELQTRLRDALGQAEQEERAQRRSGGASKTYWSDLKVSLKEAATRSPDEMIAVWLKSFGTALAAWNFDVCERLVADSISAPELQDLRKTLSRTIRALRSGNVAAAVPGLELLTADHPAGLPQSPLDDASRGPILVILGRIRLRAGNDAAALACIEKARSAAPQDGRVHAAAAEYYETRKDDALVRDLCRHAIAASPDCPDGYVGIGLSCESQGWWDEAHDWYSKAVEVVRARAGALDPLGELGHLLAPMSGALCLLLAGAVRETNPRAALAAVDKALALGVKGAGQYPERAAHELRGDILDSLSQPIEAAEALFQAGRYYAWENNPEAACRVHERANRLDPSHVPNYWQWSDSLVVASYTAQPPYVDPAKIALSLDIWNRGVQIGRPDEAYGWAYITRGRIANRQAGLVDADRWERNWETVAFTEQSLQWNPTRAFAWSTIGRMHYALGNDLNALDATGRAIEFGPDDFSSVEERLFLLVNLNRYPEARPLMAKRSAMDPPAQDLLSAIEAHLALYEAPAGAAPETHQPGLAASDAAFAAGFTQPWCRIDRARLLQLAGRAEEARKEWETLWSKSDKQDVDNQLSYAWAALMTGLNDDAIKILAARPADRIDGLSTLQRYFGFASLLSGDLDAARSHFELSLSRATSIRKCEEWLLRDFEAEDVVRLLAGRPYESAALEILEHYKAEASKRREAMRPPSSPLDEIRGVIDSLVADRDTASWSWIGAQAAAARLSLEAREWDSAGAAYRVLQAYPERFYTARRGLDLVIDGLVADADELPPAESGRAAAAYESILAAKQYLAPEDHERLAGIRARAGFARFEQGEFTAAREHFRLALQDYGDSVDPGARLAAVCAPRLSGVAQIWALDDDWKAWAEEAAKQGEPGRSQCAAINQARASLMRSIGERFQLSSRAGESGKLLPVVTPISVELGRGVVEGAGIESALIKQYVPEMRKRIQESAGVLVPGVRFRDSSEMHELDQSYIITLDEVPLVLGHAHAGWRYAPHPVQDITGLGIPATACEESANPMDDTPGCWVQPDYWQQVTAAGRELWPDVHYFITCHLEAVLRRNLNCFLGVQEIENLVEQWKKDPSLATLVSKALPTAVSRWRFTSLLRQLVRDLVPITNTPAILLAVQTSGLTADDVSRDVLAVRLSLREQLPGNRPASVTIEVPAEIEEKIAHAVRHESGRTFFALLPGDVQELLSAVRTLVGSEHRKSVAIVRDASVRQFFRSLVELEFPELLVIAREELLAEAGVVT